MSLEELLKKFLRFSTAGPALTRFYLMPKMWDDWQGKPFSVKLHYIKMNDRDWHNHPWDGVSFIFGKYLEAFEDEMRMEGVWRCWTSTLRKGFNRISANRRHKVFLKDGKPVWTLFINFKKVNPGWSYGENFKPWEGSDQERANARVQNAAH